MPQQQTVPPKGSIPKRARVLIVDDEPATIELVADVVGRATNCKLFTAADLAQAKVILQSEDVDLLLADLNLPDGNGMTLLPQLAQSHPAAAAVVITGEPSINGAIDAMRAGSFDFLAKPFTADSLLARVRSALDRQALVARKHKRLSRLKSAVRRLNTIRRTISKKVDLLCNDLVSAYGELSRQVDVVRTQEGFRKLVNQARDLEQLLCHTMDFLLRQAGYTNVAIWLASEEQDFELGAYMKYTIPGDKPLVDAMKEGIVTALTRENFIHAEGEQLRDKLTAAERTFLDAQTLMGTNCTYLGESLATVVMFRDSRSPFTDTDEATLRAISPIFSVALANIVRRSEDGPDDDGGGWNDDRNDDNSGGTSPFYDDSPTLRRNNRPKKPTREKGSEADWWKRGEAPPF